MSNRLEALRVFFTAADAANFREAAVRLSVSPQVVTRAVRELEEELGEPLFHRSTRGVQLTDFGRQLAGTPLSASKSSMRLALPLLLPVSCNCLK
jgi:DNA-binding transcriptional LysR family regulator